MCLLGKCLVSVRSLGHVFKGYLMLPPREIIMCILYAKPFVSTCVEVFGVPWAVVKYIGYFVRKCT